MDAITLYNIPITAEYKYLQMLKSIPTLCKQLRKSVKSFQELIDHIILNK